MNYKSYSSEGFILGRRNFGEGDRILTLFTRDFGKISLIAKGVRKLTSRKRGGVEIFNHVKFSAIKGKSLDILTEVQVIDSFDEIRADLRRVSVGYYLCEVIGKITRDNEEHSEIFNVLKEYFKKLTISRNLKQLRMDFIHEVMVFLGFWPEGAKMDNPDLVLEGIIERKLNSSRVGRKMLQSG